MGRKQSDFIYSKYIPRGLILKDPRSMKKDEIIKFFDHVGNRQSSHGIKDAFRFKHVLSSRRKAKVVETSYADPGPDSLVNAETAPATLPEPLPNSNQTSSTFTFRLQRVPAPQEPSDGQILQHAEINTVPPPALSSRRRPRPTGNIENNSVEAPALSSRPRPRPTGKAKEQTNAATSGSMTLHTGEKPTLTLNTDFQWERPIDLDPALDPAFDFMPQGNDLNDMLPWLEFPPASSTSNVLISPELASTSTTLFPSSTSSPVPNIPGSSKDSLNRSPVSQSHGLAEFENRTPRRRAKKADVLAMEEAQSLMAKTRSRR